MTDLAPSKQIIQEEECTFRMPVSEALITKIGADINYLFTNTSLSVQNNAGTYIGASETIVPFATTMIDTAAGWDGNFYTIPFNGNYVVIAKINSTFSAQGTSNLLKIKKNTSIIIASEQQTGGTFKAQDSLLAFA